MLFSRVPTLSISISTLSPGFIQSGGVRRAPTPPGVPVTSTSPGSSVVHVDTYSMIFGILKIICSVVACCMRSPLRRHDSVILVFGGISSAVTIQGPNPVGGPHPGAEAAGLREVLAGGPLDGVALPVAHRAVVVAAVARDVAPRILLRDAPAGFADDHRDLGLEVEVLRFLRPDDRLLMPDLRFRDADEDRRLLRVVAPGLDDVVLVVQADAENLARVGNHRQPADVAFLVIGRGVQLLRRLGVAVARDQREKVRVLVADVALQVDNAFASDDAVAGSLRGAKRCESHKCRFLLRFLSLLSATWGCSSRTLRECGIFTHASSVLPSPTAASSKRRAGNCSSCSSAATPRSTTRSCSPPASRATSSSTPSTRSHSAWRNFPACERCTAAWWRRR